MAEKLAAAAAPPGDGGAAGNPAGYSGAAGGSAAEPAAAGGDASADTDSADAAGSGSNRGLRRRVGGRLMGAGAWSLVAVLLLVAGLIFVASRTVTLQWAAQQAVELSDGRLQIEGITGSVLSEIAADSVSWRDGGLVVTITAPRFTYQPFALLDGLVRMERISAADVVISLPPVPPAGEPRQPIRLPGAMAALLPVAIERVDAQRVVVRREDRELATLYNLEAVFRHDGDRMNASLLNLDLFVNGTRIGMRGEAAVLARAPYATDGRLAVQVPIQRQALRVDVRLNGPVGELAVRATTAFAGAPIEARTVVHSLDPRPLRQVRVEVKDFDLARYDRNLPSTRITGTYEAEVMPAWASERKPLLIGPLNLTNAMPGSIDRRRIPLTTLKAVVGWIEGQLEVQTLQANGPAGEIAGEGWMGDGSFRLALASEQLQVRAINSTLKPRTVVARVAVEPLGTAGNDRGAAAAKGGREGSNGRRLADAGLGFDVEARDPSLALDVKAELAHGRLRISRARVQLRPTKGGMAAPSGMASFRGELGVAGTWPVDLAGTFRDFDPGQLTALPPATLNGTWRVTGHAAGRDGGSVRTEVTLADSRLKDLPLAGTLAADVALKDGAPQRLETVAAKLRWGASSVAASGSLGGAADALRVTFDLPKVRELRPDLDGAMRGQGVLRGPLAAPVVEGDMEGRDLVATAGALRASMAGATLQLSAPKVRGGRTELQARFDGVEVRAQRPGVARGAATTPLVSFERLTATADGSLDAHALRIEAAADDRHLAVAANGSFDDDGLWHGSVERLEASSPGLRLQPVDQSAGKAGTAGAAAPADLRSLQPFAVSIGKGYVSARDARLGLHGVLLNLRYVDWQDPVLAIRGDAAGIAAQWLARFLDLGALVPGAGAAVHAAAGGSASGVAAAAASGVAAAVAGSAGFRQDLRLNAAIDFRGSLADAAASDWRGVLQLRRESGDLAIVPPAGGEPVQAGLKIFEASVSVASRMLKLVANIDGDHVGFLSAEAQAPLQVRGGPAWSQAALARSPLSGRVQLATDSFRWISPLTGDSWRVDGAISARLQLGGTLSEPRAKGFVSGNDLSARDPALGMHFTNGVFAAELDGDRVDIKLLRFASGEGSVAISGLAQAPGNGGSEARIIVDRLAIPLGPGERVVLSGSTTAKLHDGSLEIAGRLTADEGDIALRAGGAASASPGPVAVAPAPDAAVGVDVDVEVDFGRLFRVSGSGIDADLGGAVRLHGRLPHGLRATGTAALMHGSFAADGRRLRIERGRLAYDGPVDNPSLDIVAIREGLKVEPGVAVSGPAQAPVVDLVSEPEVGEADQLSWLVLGTSMADARRAGDLPTLQAVADETRGALAAAGTRLSSRLAAICEQSLEAIRGVLKLQHEITRRLSPGGQAAVERKL